MNKDITQEYLKSILSYNPETGVFVRIKVASPQWIGRALNKETGTKNAHGYIVISILDKIHYAHRLAWLYMTGSYPELMIDHANGDKADNRFCNLREANNSQNQKNKKVRSDSTTKLKGAWKAKNRWVSQININGKKVHLGTFDTPEEAHEAYCSAADRYNKEFSNHGRDNPDTLL